MVGRAGLVVALCCIPLAAVRPADVPGSHRFEFESKHMGTTFRVMLYAADKPAADAAAKAAFARVAELDAIMSDYKKDSELMRLCRAFATEVRDPVSVGEDLFFVLSKAAELSKASDGAFDVTVGPVVQLWRVARNGYGPTGATRGPASSE